MTETDIAVIGLGQVGLALATELARAGHAVVGVEIDPARRAVLREAPESLAEPGVGEALRRRSGRGLELVAGLDRPVSTAILCVGTPLSGGREEADLSALTAATRAVARVMTAETLVITRSTLPVGTTVGAVAEILRTAVPEPLLAACPDRTIQGRAVAELRTLPQVVGASSERAAERAAAVFASLGAEIVRVSSPSAAEAVKLLNNAHTDLIYGFGNAVALAAEELGLDAGELRHATNHAYPRPDLCGPGFVGGSCLTKDPYLLLQSLGGDSPAAALVREARRLNESLAEAAWRRTARVAAEAGIDLGEAAVLVAGVAYKGRPATDDLRGSAALRLLDLIGGGGLPVLVHDFEVPAARLGELGEPVEFEEGLARADLTLLLTNHPSYEGVDAAAAFAGSDRPRVFWDAWGVFESAAAEWPASVRYLKLGRA